MTVSVRTFECGTAKEAALKPLEEAAETFAEWQTLNAATERRHGACFVGFWKESLADELADCVTACCNLAARYGLDLQASIERVEERNRERGRYGGE